MFVQTVPSINDLLFFLDSICFPHPLPSRAATNEFFVIFFRLRYYERERQQRNLAIDSNLVELWMGEREEREGGILKPEKLVMVKVSLNDFLVLVALGGV